MRWKFPGLAMRGITTVNGKSERRCGRAFARCSRPREGKGTNCDELDD